MNPNRPSLCPGPAEHADSDQALLAALLPGCVVLRQASPNGAQGALPPPMHPQELPAVAHAVASRRLEFALGRHCARQALAALCGFTGAIPAGTDRAPQWPDGVVGSITHDDALAAAAVARAADLSGIGIDIDRIDRFDGRLAPMICAAGELAAWQAQAAAVRPLHLALLFCVKEAFYKAQYPITRAWLDFADLLVQLPELPPPGAKQRCGLWQGVLQRPVGAWPQGQVFSGGWSASPSRAAAVVLLPAAGLALG